MFGCGQKIIDNNHGLAKANIPYFLCANLKSGAIVNPFLNSPDFQIGGGNQRKGSRHANKKTPSKLKGFLTKNKQIVTG